MVTPYCECNLVEYMRDRVPEMEEVERLFMGVL